MKKKISRPTRASTQTKARRTPKPSVAKPKRLPPEKVLAMELERRREAIEEAHGQALSELKTREFETAVEQLARRAQEDDRPVHLALLKSIHELINRDAKLLEKDAGRPLKWGERVYYVLLHLAIAQALAVMSPREPKRSRRDPEKSEEIHRMVTNLESRGLAHEEAVARVAADQGIHARSVANYLRDFREFIAPTREVQSYWHRRWTAVREKGHY